MRSSEEKLDGVFREYREALPDPEPSFAFLPNLWRKVEAQRRMMREARGWTSGIVTVAAILCLLLALLISFASGAGPQNYLDALDNDDRDAAVIVNDAQPKAPQEKSQE